MKYINSEIELPATLGNTGRRFLANLVRFAHEVKACFSVPSETSETNTASFFGFSRDSHPADAGIPLGIRIANKSVTKNDMQTSPDENPISANDSATAPARPIRVWLVDDSDDFRELVGDLLSKEDGIECTRQFSSATAALSTLASKNGPDVLLLDIHMGEQNGLDAIRPIKTLARSTQVLMLTTFFDSDSYTRAMDEGASGFLLKHRDWPKLVEQIRHPQPARQPRAKKRVQRANATDAPSLPHKVVATQARPNWFRRLGLQNLIERRKTGPGSDKN